MSQPSESDIGITPNRHEKEARRREVEEEPAEFLPRVRVRERRHAEGLRVQAGRLRRADAEAQGGAGAEEGKAVCCRWRRRMHALAVRSPRLFRFKVTVIFLKIRALAEPYATLFTLGLFLARARQFTRITCMTKNSNLHEVFLSPNSLTVAKRATGP